jgi:hypothetical protein
MSSTLQRRFARASDKTTSSPPVAPSLAQLRESFNAVISKASLVVVPTGLTAMIALSVMNDKLFLQELLLGFFIILALMLCKTSTLRRE